MRRSSLAKLAGLVASTVLLGIIGLNVNDSTRTSTAGAGPRRLAGRLSFRSLDDNERQEVSVAGSASTTEQATLSPGGVDEAAAAFLFTQIDCAYPVWVARLQLAAFQKLGIPYQRMHVFLRLVRGLLDHEGDCMQLVEQTGVRYTRWTKPFSPLSQVEMYSMVKAQMNVRLNDWVFLAGEGEIHELPDGYDIPALLYDCQLHRVQHLHGQLVARVPLNGQLIGPAHAHAALDTWNSSMATTVSTLWELFPLACNLPGLYVLGARTVGSKDASSSASLLMAFQAGIQPISGGSRLMNGFGSTTDAVIPIGMRGLRIHQFVGLAHLPLQLVQRRDRLRFAPPQKTTPTFLRLVEEMSAIIESLAVRQGRFCVSCRELGCRNQTALKVGTLPAVSDEGVPRDLARFLPIPFDKPKLQRRIPKKTSNPPTS